MEPTLRDSVFGKDVIKELPDNFFEVVLSCEVKLKKGYNKEVLYELLNYYSKAIEYYESINDPKYMQYSQSITLLLSQPEIAKHIKKEKEHYNYKLEAKKKFDNRDKSEDTNKVFTLLQQANKEEDKMMNVNGMINQEMDTQLSAFQKRKEEKKKKTANNASSDKCGNEGNNGNKLLKKQIKITKKAHDTEEKKKKNNNNTAFESNVNVFIDEWSSIINNTLMQNTYAKLDDEYKEKENALLDSTRSFANQIQETELLCSNESNKSIKDQFQDTIKQLLEQERVEKETIENKYATITSIIQEYINNQLANNDEKKAVETKFKQKIVHDLSELLS